MRELRRRFHQWLPEESFTPEEDRRGWWTVGAVGSLTVAAITLVVVIAAGIAGGGPETAPARVTESSCRTVSSGESGKSLSCEIQIQFSASSDGSSEDLTFHRIYGVPLGEPIEVGHTYTIHYNPDGHDPARTAVTDRDRTMSAGNRVVGVIAFGLASMAFYLRLRMGHWPFLGGRDGEEPGKEAV